MWNLVFLFTGLIFIILLLVIFLSKPKIKTKENKMFLVLSVLNLIGYIIEIALQIFVRKVGNDSIFGIELSKIYIMYIFTWFSIFSIYTFLISNSSGKLSDYSYKIIKYTHITAIILGIIGIGIMPIEKYYSNGEMYTYGMSVNFLKIMLGVYIIIWIFRLLLNFRTIKEILFNNNYNFITFCQYCFSVNKSSNINCNFYDDIYLLYNIFYNRKS